MFHFFPTRDSGQVFPGAALFGVLIDRIVNRQEALQSAKEPFPFLPVETGLRGVLAMVVGMPLGRYFVFVGSLLLAFLFLADRYMPKPITGPARADVDRSIIRLHSSHKWPERIVIDTSLPTIVPPPTTNTAEISPPRARPPKDAFALATPEVAPTVQNAVRQKRRARTIRTAAGRIASSDTIGYRAALPAGW
jgi:hypothetical protein